MRFPKSTAAVTALVAPMSSMAKEVDFADAGEDRARHPASQPPPSTAELDAFNRQLVRWGDQGDLADVGNTSITP